MPRDWPGWENRDRSCDDSMDMGEQRRRRWVIDVKGGGERVTFEGEQHVERNDSLIFDVASS